ncbi:MAG: hypothetical protein HOP31_07170 [Ignavibacteria bacterium]|nr:hypothetical protein [Ignavibacteria bacterium]
MEKTRKITISSYNYLLEFSAVPPVIRSEFLSLLLKRKNAASQKNIMLLRLIYEIIEKNKIHEWNPQAVCNTLGVSPDTLNRHRSRLLKKIKKFYTRWDESEKEAGLKIKYSGNRSDAEERYYSIKFDKAIKLMDKGLRIEAKNLLISIERKLVNSKVNKSYKYLTLLHIYERLIVYYALKTDKPKVLYFYKQLNKTVNETLKLDLSDKERVQIDILKNYGCYSANHFQFNKKVNPAKANYYLKKILKDAQNIESYDYVLRALYGLATMDKDINNNKRSEYYSQKGYQIALKTGNEPAKYAFLSILYIMKLENRQESISIKYEDILNFYFKLKSSNPLNTWALYLESFCAQICMLKNKPETAEFYKARINSNILSGGHIYAAYLLFYIEWEKYIAYIKDSLYINSDNILVSEKIDKTILQNADNACLNTINYNKSVKNGDFIRDIYMLQLLAVYFQEDNFDNEKAVLICGKLNRLINTKRNINHLRSFEIIKHCVKIVENSNTSAEIEKYIFPFKKLIDEFKKYPNEIDLMLYAIISSLARRIKNKEITAIVKDLYRWLEANHPEILAPALREIEERTSKVKLIDGSKQSAA